MKAAIYARTSKEDTKNPDRKLSIDQQVQDAQRLAKEKGYEVVSVLLDRDLTGKLPPTCWSEGGKSRPAFSALIQQIERGEVKAIFFYKRDRISRNTIIGLRFFELCQKYNIEIYATGEPISFGNDAAGRFALTVLIAAAQLQLEQITERNKRVREYLQKNRRKTAAVVTVGYRDGGKGKIDIDEDGAEIVKQVYKKYLDGSTFGELTEWCQENFPTKHPPIGKRWYRSTIRRILTNPCYTGRGIQGQQRIISDELFNEVQKAVEARANTKWGSKLKKHMLSGFLHCGYDNNPIYVYSVWKDGKAVGHSFKCREKHKDGEYPCCINEEKWNQWADHFFATAKIVQTNKDTSALEIQLAKIRRNQEALQDEFSDGKINMVEYRTMRDAISNRINKLELEIGQAAPTQVKDWHSLSVEEKRVQLRSLVKSITVYRDRVVVAYKANVRLDGWMPYSIA